MLEVAKVGLVEVEAFLSPRRVVSLPDARAVGRRLYQGRTNRDHAEVRIATRGRKHRLAKQWQTTFESLISLDQPQQCALGLSRNALKCVANFPYSHHHDGCEKTTKPFLKAVAPIVSANSAFRLVFCIGKDSEALPAT